MKKNKKDLKGFKDYVFICYNEHCEECDNEQIITIKESELFKKENEFKFRPDTNIECPACKKVMDNYYSFKGENITEEKQFTVEIGKFSNLPLAEKQKALKKRSKEHFNKSGLRERRRLLLQGKPA